MEYVIIGLLILLLIVLYFKKPKELTNLIVTLTVKNLREREAEIVLGLYNKLPSHIKEKIDSKTISYLVSFTIGVAIDVLEKTIVEEKSS